MINRSCYRMYARGKLQWGEFTHFSATGLVKQGFSSRWGGVSVAPYHTLNLGLHTGDRSDAVQENRRRYCEVFGLDIMRAVTAEQVHGEGIAVVTEQECGRGVLTYETALLRTDALITNTANIPLLLFYADCVPVYLLDPQNKAIGVIHAGWKGTVGKIGAKTITMMERVFGTKPEHCLVAVGPSIGPCCYEVDAYVYDKVTTAFHYAAELLRSGRPGKWQFDLWTANRRQLEDIGVLTQNIVIAGICTSCHNDVYFSYRANQGTTGRMGALMALR